MRHIFEILFIELIIVDFVLYLIISFQLSYHFDEILNFDVGIGFTSPQTTRHSY